VPKPGSAVTVGPLYEAKVIEFGGQHWSLGRAVERSESLRRARQSFRRLGERWRTFIHGSASGF
jgi:hypothetical protein